MLARSAARSAPLTLFCPFNQMSKCSGKHFQTRLDTIESLYPTFLVLLHSARGNQRELDRAKAQKRAAEQ